MGQDDTTKELIAGIVELRERLSELWQDAVTRQNSGITYQRFRRWKERAVRYVRDHVSDKEAGELHALDASSYQVDDFLGDLSEEVMAYDNFLKALIEAIKDDPTLIQTTRGPDAAGKSNMHVPETGKVFIVHGHDEANTMRLRDLLRERFNLEPVILAAQPGRGRTLIEKFEDEARSCSFAFVLLTPDDQVATPSGEYTQARPNVIFELGWFYGRLGRARVVLLLKGGTKIHSDLEGVSKIEFDRKVDAALVEIETELKAAGLI